MMSGVFGSIVAAQAQDKELMNFALKQPGQFAKYLQDDKSRLYHHSWWKILKRPYPKQLFWGRGNGWVCASFALMYEQTKAPENRMSGFVKWAEKLRMYPLKTLYKRSAREW